MQREREREIKCARAYIYIYDAGLPPPPTPWYPPLPVKWVVVLFGLVAFPVPRLVLFGLVPSPPPPVEWGLWSVWSACGGAVCLQTYGMVAAACSNVIVTCLVPSRPPCGWGLWSFWLAPPRLCGAVCSTKICMVWLLPLVSSNVIDTCSLPYQNMMLLFSPCKRCPCPCSDAVLRSCEEALAGIILHRPLPLVCVGSFRLCMTAGSRGGSGARGHARAYIHNIYIYICVCVYGRIYIYTHTYTCIYIYIELNTYVEVCPYMYMHVPVCVL